MDGIIEKILKENMAIINEKQREAMGILMGKSMILLRGRADGQKINSMLKKKLEYYLKANSSAAGTSTPE